MAALTAASALAACTAVAEQLRQRVEEVAVTAAAGLPASGAAAVDGLQRHLVTAAAVQILRGRAHTYSTQYK